ncbi:MAG: HAD family phosphatase [Actinomycetota bacterium]|nr:HAD family phosphatase [Actinomycetota bacterium]
MDGTLVDTEPYWMEAEFELVEQHGGSWTDEHALNLVGNDLLVSGRYIQQHSGIDLEPAEIVEQLLDRVIDRVRLRVPWRPGARELLADLCRRAVPCALVTMSYQRFVDPVLDVLEPETFAAVVTGDVVSQGKPHPGPYLEAARRLGVAPEQCVAIEDSNTGAESAEAAGCRVLVVPNHVSVLAGPRRAFASQLPATLAGLCAAVGKL